MVDIHCHILPDVDDGSANLEMSEIMLQQASEIGIERIVATPHIDYRFEKEYYELILDKIKPVQEIAEKLNIHLTLGAEIFHHSNIVSLLEEHPEFYLDNDVFILIEDGFMHKPFDFKENIFDIILNKKKVVLAHPERYKWLEEDRDLLEYLFNSGVLFQLDAGSLNGSFSRRAQSFGWELIDMGYAHCVGSDAHNLTGRSFKELAKARDQVLEKKGEEISKLLFQQNPLAILNGGEEIQIIPATIKAKSLLERMTEKFRR